MFEFGIEYGLSAELDDLYVLPEARGAGVAGGLLEAICAWCRQKGWTALLVTVTPDGEAHHHLSRFYQRRGFARTGRVILERALCQDCDCSPSLDTAGRGERPSNVR